MKQTMSKTITINAKIMAETMMIAMTKRTTLNQIIETQLGKWLAEQRKMPKLILCGCGCEHSEVLDKCPACGEVR